MAVDYVKIPATGTGDATPGVATEDAVAADGSTKKIQQVSLANIERYLHEILNAMVSPISLDFAARQRVNVEAFSSAISLVTNEGGISSMNMPLDSMHQVWCSAVRSHFS